MNKVTEELKERARQDQAMRNAVMEGRAKWNASVDQQNAQYLRELVDAQGWPLKSTVGAEASEAAWLIVQHADHDPQFQARCLELLKAAPSGETDPTHVAYLEDRVRVNQGKPQLYGTQFQGEGDTLKPWPIENAAELDRRRSKAGLGPFKKYEREMKAAEKHYRA